MLVQLADLQKLIVKTLICGKKKKKKYFWEKEGKRRRSGLTCKPSVLFRFVVEKTEVKI